MAIFKNCWLGIVIVFLVICLSAGAHGVLAVEYQNIQQKEGNPAAVKEDKTETAKEDTGTTKGDEIPPEGEATTVKEVVVVGETIKEDPRLNDPVPQTGVSRETFELRNNRRAGDVIKRLPGVMFGGPPGEEQDPQLLGINKEFTRVQVDGVQLPGTGEKREFQLNRISSFIIDDVRIIRNPTAEYESDGIDGRIDVRTRPIPEELTVYSRLGYGSLDGFHDPFWHEVIGFGVRPTKWFGILGVFDNLEETSENDKERVSLTGSIVLLKLKT